ncbi:site-specific integrase [Pseudonocardia sp. TRM90224]|uniref:site-specific integrase n=1 Tax=Pseudonocardia sp. TRM90224 TaxID=2812678 RepID=UPI001E6304B8|nr:site-specific integrase [Pseudonocardia sp. TRM90224]
MAPEPGTHTGSREVAATKRTALTHHEPRAVAEVVALQEQARSYAHNSRAQSTWRAYDSDMADFRRWCAAQQPPHAALPATAETVALYLTALAPVRAPSTLRRRMAAISVAHQLSGLESPTAHPAVRAVWAGIRRTHPVAPRKVRAARTPDIAALIAPLVADGPDGSTLADVRDRALLLLGFAGALRRSELVALDLADVTEDDDGLRLVIRKSKTDQDGEGTLIGLPYGSHPATCPVRAWRAWIARSGLADGPAFRAVDRHGRLATRRLSDRAVADMIKRRAAAAGLQGRFGGHSLRAGFATESYSRGVPELAVMRHGRWRSATVMRGYVAEGALWNDNAAARIGL